MSGNSQDPRKRVLDLRKSHPPAELAALSARICQRLLAALSPLASGAPNRLGAMPVALYRNRAEEPDLSAVESFFHSAQARLHYPRILDQEGKAMDFVRADPRHPPHWETGPYGIRQPVSGLAIDPAELQLIIVPGVAFGLSGERVGMGMGYYDRFLAKAPNAIRIALAFEFQIFPKLEQNPWDQSVHWIITEKSDIRVPAAHERFHRLLG